MSRSNSARLAPLAAVALTFGALTATSLVAATPAHAYAYDCPGGMFCGWEGRDGTGNLVVQANSDCFLHDIGNAGKGDLLTSYWNRTGKQVTLLNWMGDHWETLAVIQDSERGTLSRYADKKTDAVRLCD
ncbi:peptidase inhibitor family I36 protein [Nocardia sp. NPDC004711]